MQIEADKPPLSTRWCECASRAKLVSILAMLAVVLDKQMHQTMLQMCAAPVCAAHRTSQVQILAPVPGSCMWHA